MHIRKNITVAINMHTTRWLMEIHHTQHIPHGDVNQQLPSNTSTSGPTPEVRYKQV
jgi:hypothetical protein